MAVTVKEEWVLNLVRDIYIFGLVARFRDISSELQVKQCLFSKSSHPKNKYRYVVIINNHGECAAGKIVILSTIKFYNDLCIVQDRLCSAEGRSAHAHSIGTQ